MNREEAIYFANCLKNNYTVDLNDMEAFCDMAIKALAQEPTTKNDLGVDCISRQAVIDLMMQKWGENFSGDDAMQESIDAIRDMPSVTPIRPKGHWIRRNSFLVPYKCSECNYESEGYDNFCPNCGADMWGEEE